MNPPHLLLVHQAFASPNDSGGTRHYELGQRWVEAGNRMTVVASDRNYLSGEATAGARVENLGGITVERAYSGPALHRSFLWRIISFLIFCWTSLLAGLRTRGVDVVMGTTPPLPQAFTAWLLAALKRKPFLLEVRDLWPEFAIAMGVLKNKLVIALARAFEAFLYARADHILVNSPAYRDYLIANKKVPAAKITLIANGVDTAMFKGADGRRVRDQLQVNGDFIAMYAGAIGLANDIPVVLQAAERLSNESDIRIVLVGDGKERPRLEQQAKDAGLTNVIFTGSQPKSAMPAYLAAADCCIAVLQNIPMFTTTYPNKVFDYMAAGKPTLLAIDGVIRQVVEKADGGMFVIPGQPEALANAVLLMRADRERARKMGNNAQQYVERHFDRAQQAAQFVALVRGLVKG